MATKFPKTLGECIDLAYAAEKRRLDKQREFNAELEKLKAVESEIEEHILRTFDKNAIEGARGSIANASVSESFVPTVKDWPSVWAFIKKQNAFELLEKRMSSTAWRERYEAGKLVPGTEPFCKKTLHLTKIKK